MELWDSIKGRVEATVKTVAESLIKRRVVRNNRRNVIITLGDLIDDDQDNAAVYKEMVDRIKDL